MTVRKDEYLGEIKGRMPMYGNGLDSSGEIILCEKGIIVSHGGNTIRAPFSYVKMLEKAGDLPMGRFSVEMDVYDQLGQKHYFMFGFSDSHFAALKKAVAAATAPPAE